MKIIQSFIPKFKHKSMAMRLCLFCFSRLSSKPLNCGALPILQLMLACLRTDKPTMCNKNVSARLCFLLRLQGMMQYPPHLGTPHPPAGTSHPPSTLAKSQCAVPHSSSAILKQQRERKLRELYWLPPCSTEQPRLSFPRALIARSASGYLFLVGRARNPSPRKLYGCL